ncbi:hypothetical protein BDZ89DRAFT_1067058 [Hymenopellis radicata]|nr:hypothetical protein BDZ89DRAFT_1067058 [Hymenopellis radicata]
MPISGSHFTAPSDAYFKSLEELDIWASSPKAKSTTPLKYYPRTGPSRTAGKLLGGYTESPFALSYTFNYWNVCDTFIYFSHHRVTIPPTGWTSAAHRQGVKMLGVLIFEGGAEADCLRLLVGKLPKSKTGPAKQHSHSQSIPVSPHYARLLAALAYEHGFDGYLLNFECPLQGGLEQTRALSAWITILQDELREKVGNHAEVIWYDSVIVTGQLAWQDRLNSLNLPFFLSSHGLFGNYTWRKDYPTRTAEYFLSLDPNLTGTHPQRHFSAKSLGDIYMGVDVWGRGSHGGGGFGSYKALSHISPESLGLSVALFGQAWTWESEQDKDGWTWAKWWITNAQAPRREGEPECVHGPFLPVSSFFAKQAPPDPVALALHTTFSPGVGLGWFVNGVKVYTSDKGWTDVDKQTSVGDLVWPRPSVAWEGDVEDFQGEVAITPEICTSDAWNGGSSLRLALSEKDQDHSVYRCVWVPVQSLALTEGRSYEAALVYKLEEHADLDVSLSVKTDMGTVTITPTAANDTALPEGWTKLAITFSVDKEPTSASIGVVIAIVLEDEPLKASILLGQMNVFPSPSNAVYDASLLWADYDTDSSMLTWEVAASFKPLTGLTITSPEDPIPAWDISPSAKWFPRFVYYNVYASPFTTDVYVGGPEDASVVWIGTSGYERGKKKFVVDSRNMPFDGNGKIRFFIQGVLDTGEVIPWERCVFVDKL